MGIVEESKMITGVRIVRLESYSDDRGRFMETFRKEWFPERTWDIIQSNRSDSKKGVLRGLHYHHNQADYWYVLNGSLRAGLVDIRADSETYLYSQTIEMSEHNEIGLLIPEGVAHGFIALTDVTLTYIVDNYFNGGADENGVAWNDPQLRINWGVTNPIISARDLQNRLLRDIPNSELPRSK